MNYADIEVPWTRISEFKHFHPHRTYGPDTIIAREFSRFASANDEPYYPINLATDKTRYDGYRDLATREANVLFGGRLSTYRYLDMHQAIGAARKAWDQQIGPRLTQGKPLGCVNENAGRDHALALKIPSFRNISIKSISYVTVVALTIALMPSAFSKNEGMDEALAQNNDVSGPSPLESRSIPLCIQIDPDCGMAVNQQFSCIGQSNQMLWLHSTSWIRLFHCDTPLH